jgi:hypothetical protein
MDDAGELLIRNWSERGKEKFRSLSKEKQKEFLEVHNEMIKSAADLWEKSLRIIMYEGSRQLREKYEVD